MSSVEQLSGALGSSERQVLTLHAVLSALLAQVLAQQLSRLGFEDSDEQGGVPLHIHLASDPTWRKP
jgi:hypothetical protein